MTPYFMLRRYMAEKLPIRRKTLFNQPINTFMLFVRTVYLTQSESILLSSLEVHSHILQIRDSKLQPHKWQFVIISFTLTG